MQFYFTHYGSELGFDNEDLLSAAILDLYTLESVGMRAYRIEEKPIGSNFSSSSVTFVPVTNSNISHTFTYPNAMIRCHNIAIANTTNGQSTIVIAEIQGLASDQHGHAEQVGTVAREMVAMSLYSGIPTGVSQNLRLIMQVSGGTGAMASTSHLIWEIEEWE